MELARQNALIVLREKLTLKLDRLIATHAYLAILHSEEMAVLLVIFVLREPIVLTEIVSRVLLAALHLLLVIINVVHVNQGLNSQETEQIHVYLVLLDVHHLMRVFLNVSYVLLVMIQEDNKVLYDAILVILDISLQFRASHVVYASLVFIKISLEMIHVSLVCLGNSVILQIESL